MSNISMILLVIGGMIIGAATAARDIYVSDPVFWAIMAGNVITYVAGFIRGYKLR